MRLLLKSALRLHCEFGGHGCGGGGCRESQVGLGFGKEEILGLEFSVGSLNVSLDVRHVTFYLFRCT